MRKEKLTDKISLSVNFLLMFHFNDAERRSIIEDYKEWYIYQLEQESEESAIFSSLEKPENEKCRRQSFETYLRHIFLFCNFCSFCLWID